MIGKILLIILIEKNMINNNDRKNMTNHNMKYYINIYMSLHF